MLITLWEEAPLREYIVTLMTWWREVPKTRILPGDNQESLGHASLECKTGGGHLSELRNSDCDRELLPWGIHRYWGRSYTVAWGEYWGMGVLGVHLGWGGVSAPADLICGPVEVPPIIVGLCATHHSRYRYIILGSGGWATGKIPPGTFSRVHVSYPRKGNHRSAGQTVCDCPP